MLPWVTPRFFRRYGGRPSELEAKFLLLALFGMGALAAWADSEPVLPAYLIGMVLAGTVGKDHALVRRLRTVTFGLLTPFYFIRAGSFVSVPALLAAPASALGLLLAKLVTKTVGVWPATLFFRYPKQEAAYTTLLMSTGLTFGSISALFGLTHRVISQAQYSFLIAAVIGSAVVPTLIANAFFLPRYLLPKPAPARGGSAVGRCLGRGDCRVRARTTREGAGMTPKRILVAHDGSKNADDAFETALDFAALCRARLEVVSVATPPEPPTRVETEAALEAATEHYEEVFEGLRRRARGRDVDLETRVLVGHAAEQILRLAADTGADLIVVGHRGRSAIREWLFGSTSRRVVSHAPCSVLVVRQQ